MLGNLFGTPQRVARALGVTGGRLARERCAMSASCWRMLKEPEPPKGLEDAWQNTRPVFMKVLDMAPKDRSIAPCQDVVWEGRGRRSRAPAGADVLAGRRGPLITWGLTVTRGPHKTRQNLGIYRQQVIARNKVIMRWLAHRGGALDFRDHAQESPGKPFPVAVALGADPATILGAVTPVPDSLSEYQFAGLLRGGRTEIVKCLTHDLRGAGVGGDRARGLHRAGRRRRHGLRNRAEGPFGDHTGYYNEVERFPVLTIERITHAPRSDLPLHLHRQAARRAGDAGRRAERSVRAAPAEAISRDRRLLPAAGRLLLSPRGGVAEKAISGHAKRVMFGVWSFLRQFMYTKFIIVTDDDVDIRDWKEVVWAMTTRVDPERDTLIVESTPIDYLDFASPVAGLGSKMGIDATQQVAGRDARANGAGRSRWTPP